MARDIRRTTGLATGLALALTAGLTAGLSGCSFQATIDAVVDPQRQELIRTTAAQLCTDPMALTAQFDPVLTRDMPATAPRLLTWCPAGQPRWQITTYTVNSNAVSGQPTVHTENALLVAQDASGGQMNGRWSEMALVFTRIADGPIQIAGMNVSATIAKPASLTMIEQWDASVVWVRIGGALFAALIIGGVWWMARRYRAGRAARAATVPVAPVQSPPPS